MNALRALTYACAPDPDGDRVLPCEVPLTCERVRIRLVPDHIVIPHIVADPAEAVCEIVRVHDGEAAGLFCEICQALLGSADAALASR
jgi:hypothetical protein